MIEPLKTEPGSIAIHGERSADGELATLQIFGPLVTPNRELFKRLVLEEVAEARAKGIQKFRLDFAHCTDLDLGGVGTLVLVARRIREAGGLVHAGGLKASDDIAKLFELTRLDQILAIDLTPEDSHG